MAASTDRTTADGPIEQHSPSVAERLMSVDALRGFDMIWIIGGGAIVKALRDMDENSVTRFLTTQLQHVTWEGFHFYDLIFPLFLFIVGVSLVFSLDKALADGGRSAVMGRIVRRSLLLYGLGVFYYGGISLFWPEVHLGGVLHRIAACYLLAALTYCAVRNAVGLLTVSAILLVGYWALVRFVPFPDLQLDQDIVTAIAARIGSDSPHDIAATVSIRVSGILEEGRNLTNYMDFLYLPGKKAQVYYINEGLLSTLPSVALPLFGAVAGLLLKNRSRTPQQKIVWLVTGGLALVALGLLWSVEFPIIKRIWTSSFVLLTAGLSAMLLAVFYGLIDVCRYRRWCQPFVWIGCNALTLYLAAKIVNFQSLASNLAGGDLKLLLDENIATGAGSLLVAVVGLALMLLLARFLYRNRIFLRV